MSKINLLPWREARRNELQKQFIITLVIVAVMGVAVWGAGHYYHVQLIDVQNIRIAYVENSIKEIDKKIEEIKRLEDEKERLLSRMHAIEQLQGNRPLIVHLFDALVSSLTTVVTITSLTQRGMQITINGLAKSNARVSSFMRNLANSEWLANPNLKVIQESKAAGDKQINSFTLTFSQVVPKVEEAEDA